MVRVCGGLIKVQKRRTSLPLSNEGNNSEFFSKKVLGGAQEYVSSPCSQGKRRRLSVIAQKIQPPEISLKMNEASYYCTKAREEGWGGGIKAMCRCSFWKKGGRHKYDDDREPPLLYFALLRLSPAGEGGRGAKKRRLNAYPVV